MSGIARQLEADPMLLPPRTTPYVLKDVLEKVEFGCRDELILDWGDCVLRFHVNSVTDTVISQFDSSPLPSRKEYRSIRSAKPWKGFVGKWCGGTWLTVDQEGYWDGAMIGFDGIEPNILLQTIASSLKVFVIGSAEKTKSPRKVKAKTKRG
jgi:hypothetical protein